jgi:hypothetical protein
MRKYISPNVAFFMGVFMLISAMVYTSVIASTLDLTTLDRSTRFILGIPVYCLTISATYAMVWAAIMKPKLRFSVEADAWVLKQG